MTKWALVASLIVSLAWNLYFYNRIQKVEDFRNLVSQKDQLINNGYDEIVMNYLDKIKNSNDEILKNQGKIEGILAVVNNFKPEENLHSAIWHEGYYRGVDSYGDMMDLIRKNSYEEGYQKASTEVAFDSIFMKSRKLIKENWQALGKASPDQTTIPYLSKQNSISSKTN